MGIRWDCVPDRTDVWHAGPGRDSHEPALRVGHNAHARSRPGQVSRLWRAPDERLVVGSGLRRSVSELAPRHMVARPRHRPGSRALRAAGGHAFAAGPPSTHGERGTWTRADPPTGATWIPGAELRSPNAAVHAGGAPGVRDDFGCLLPPALTHAAPALARNFVLNSHWTLIQKA